MPTHRYHTRGIAAIWIILALVVFSIGGAKLWSNAKQRQREELSALEQRRQTAATIDREKREFEAKVAAERSKGEYEKAAASLGAMRSRWEDGVKLAVSTSRVALHGPVANLQTLKRETDMLLLPDCLGHARQKLSDGMQLQIDGFLSFMRNDLKMGELLAQAKFEEAAAAMRESKEAAERCGRATVGAS